MRSGGSATHWNAITLRITPEDFRTQPQFGYGIDWPITYDDLEPYYGVAEKLIGVTGTDNDNPFATHRTDPYPLPPFELSYHDQIFRDQLQQQGIVLHTTPQARARHPYNGRTGCQNFGACHVCPIGARYSPTFHLNQALSTGRCSLRTDTSIRRIELDETGKASTLIYQENDSSAVKEHSAQIIIVAAGGLENARLLLLSPDSRHPDGLGNAGGHVGHLAFHSLWTFRLKLANPVHPGRFGGITGQSHQFLNAPTRGRHASVKVEFTETRNEVASANDVRSGTDILEASREISKWRDLTIHAESLSSAQKYVKLSEKVDRFRGPFHPCSLRTG